MSRRDEILEAALESFAAGGEIAIEEIRSRSGASVGSIYHHFGDKDGIAAALYVETLTNYQAGALRALRRADGAEEGVKALVRHHLRWVERNPDRARFLLQSGAARRVASEELRELNRSFSAVIEGWVERQAAIRPISLAVFYATVIGPAQEASRLRLAGRIPSLRRIEDELADAAWRAIRVD